MNPDREINKSRFVVIESLTSAERHTGKELFDRVLSSKKKDGLEICAEYHELASKQEFVDKLDFVYDTIRENEMLTLQIDAHGGELGLKLSSNEILTWECLHNLLRPINVKLGGMLVVVLSMCESKSVYGYISPKERAPFFGVFVSKKSIYPYEIMDDLTFLYENYDGPMDYVKAQRILDEDYDNRCFTALDSKTFFKLSFNPERDPALFKHLVNDLYCREKSCNPNYTIEEARNLLKKEFERAITEDLPYFSFADIYGL